MAQSMQKYREMVLQLLYSLDTASPDLDFNVELLMAELEISKKNVRAAQEMAQQILAKKKELDLMIASVSDSYAVERIQRVTLNILRLALFELFFQKQTPPKVAIAEAIRLSRKFNTPESAAFVNALLDQLYQASLGHPVETKPLKKHLDALEESEERAADAAKAKREEKDE